MTTKEQERKALDQIKSILATLDKDGWINTAFAGVVEDAEENIENDFALSWKDRAETAKAKYAESVERMQEVTDKIKEETEKVNKLKERTLSAKDLDCCLYAIRQLIQDRQAKAAEAAAEIVRLADDTKTEDFARAVKNNRFYTGLANEYDELESRVYNAYAASL